MVKSLEREVKQQLGSIRMVYDNNAIIIGGRQYNFYLPYMVPSSCQPCRQLILNLCNIEIEMFQIIYRHIYIYGIWFYILS